MTRLRAPGGLTPGLVILDWGLGTLVTIGGACVVSRGGDTWSIWRYGVLALPGA